MSIFKINFEASDMGATSTKDYELSVSKGNKKPIPPYVWLVSMQSASNCYCRLNGLCPIASDCYGLDYETNPLFKEATLNCRNKDEEAIDFLVRTEGGASFLASELIKSSNRARNTERKLRFLRWNMTGDIKSPAYIDFVEAVAVELWEALGVVSVVYTHNKAVALDYQKRRGANTHEYLRVLGSGFMLDANFDCFATDPQALTCSSDCVECFNKYGVGLCYDTQKKGGNHKRGLPTKQSNQRGNINDFPPPWQLL